MPDYNLQNKKEISWSFELQKNRKNSEAIIILWIIALTLAIITFIFTQNFISTLVVLSGALALHAHFHHMDDVLIKDVTVGLKGVQVNKLLYPYKNIRRYNIINNPENQSEKLLLLDLLSVLTPDLVIPLADVDEEELDLYLSQFIEEDEKMQIPFTHTLAQWLGM